VLNELWAVPVAFTAGVLNAVAGGGTFMMFPTLNAVGLPQRIANMSCTLALWPGLLSGAVAARGELEEFGLRQKTTVAALSMFGGAAGATLLLLTPPSKFQWIVPWLLLCGALILAFGGQLRNWASAHPMGDPALTPAQFRAAKPAVAVMITGLAIYAGYFGAGAGIILLAGFAMAGLENVHAANALKLLVQSSANFAAVAVFITRRDVPWGLIGAMAVASSIGGFAGQRFSRHLPAPLFRGIIVALGIALALVYFTLAYRNGVL
jgi:uncharacterized membrane protein YfcA